VTSLERARIWDELHAFAACMTQAKVHFQTIVSTLSEIDERESERNARRGNRKSKNAPGRKP
jgi:hypothetical protein